MTSSERRVQVLCKHLLADSKPTLHTQKACGTYWCFLAQTQVSSGIIALVGKEPVPQYLMEGLRILEARGYDSAGISTIANGELVTTKFASSGSTNNAIDLVKSKLEPHASAMIGTFLILLRW